MRICVNNAHCRCFTMAADAIPVLIELSMRQLAAGIPFEGVAQRDAVRTLRH
jgi:hypothetical protein